MKVLITGSKGQLGKNYLKIFQKVSKLSQLTEKLLIY